MLILWACIVCVLCACQRNGSNSEFISQITETIPERVTWEFTQTILDKYRPKEATIMPDSTAAIDDIRILVKPREHVPQTTGIASFDDRLRNTTFLQIYYGYYSAGQWFDIPCENFELKGIFNMFHNYTGYDAAGESHIVRIGPYLLICIRHYSAETPRWATHCTIKDTLGSTVSRPFDDYYTQTSRDSTTHGYGYLKEDVSSLSLDGEVDYVARDAFDQYYYVILDYENLPSDYSLTVTYWEGLGNACQTLTYAEIVELIGSE